MSNQLVGTVYQQIIEEVLEASKTDVEENGFDESVLDELRKGWQQKLSDLKVAQFPWDPKVEAAPVNNVPAPSQQPSAAPTTYTQAQFSPQNEAQHLPPQQPLPPGPGVKQDPAVKTEPQIKQEPGLYKSPVTIPPFPAKNNLAQARATQLIEKQYGPKAVQSINNQHGPNGAGLGPGSVPGPAGARPSVPMPTVQNTMQYREQVARQQQLQMQAAASGANNLAKSQADGTADAFEGVVTQRRPDGNEVELGRLSIDKMLHDQIAANAKEMEGGGLMLPLKQAVKQRSKKAAKNSAGVPQADGPDDDADYDEDAINSDLDDPEDENEDEDDDEEASGPIMLCMYDKVQRVKNKWKCTLKDGVLTVNGKEYVFQKATGEYEW